MIEGIIPAVHTPMRQDGSLDLDRIPAQVDHLLGDGVLTCGTTGRLLTVGAEAAPSVARRSLHCVTA